MKKFIIPCHWQYYGEFEVEAETLQEAINKVDNEEPPYNDLPDKQEYVDGSFKVNAQAAMYINID